MNKKFLGIFIFMFLFGTVLSLFSQGNTCTMIWSDSTNQIWRDDNTKEVMIVTPRESFTMRVVRFARGGYELACTGGIREVVDTADQLAGVLRKAGIHIPYSGVELYSWFY